MKRLLVAPLILAISTPVFAEVDRKVHELCLSANDYKGCVELNKKSVSKANKWEFPNLLDKFKKETRVKQPTKKELKERCLLGNEKGYEAGLVGVIEMVDECISVLTEVGPTVLTIDPLTHAGCPSGGGEGVGAYLACVTSNSDWEIPADKKDLNQAAAKSECPEYGPGFRWNSKTGKCQHGSRTVEEIRESGVWPGGSSSITVRETYNHKGKTYTASRACKPPRRMVWTTYPSFLGIGGKVEEAGCMTPLELEAFNREKRLRRASRPVIMNNPAPMPQPTRSGVINAPNNYQPQPYSSPFAPKQPSQIRLYNNNSPGGVQNCSRFGNTNSFNCY
tara:strand:- start:1000 stop:2004 length:1005 start_codon:yes stop_codon:yes gene_type:complete